MDEKNAWKSFSESGKIEDYIKYTQIRHESMEFSGGIGAQGVVRNETENGRSDYKGADSGGERPPHHNSHT